MWLLHFFSRLSGLTFGARRIDAWLYRLAHVCTRTTRIACYINNIKRAHRVEGHARSGFCRHIAQTTCVRSRVTQICCTRIMCYDAMYEHSRTQWHVWYNVGRFNRIFVVASVCSWGRSVRVLLHRKNQYINLKKIQNLSIHDIVWTLNLGSTAITGIEPFRDLYSSSARIIYEKQKKIHLNNHFIWKHLINSKTSDIICFLHLLYSLILLWNDNYNYYSWANV